MPEETVEERILSELRQTKDLIEVANASKVAMDALRQEWAHVTREVAYLVRVIRDGNGKSMVTRVDLLEQEMTRIWAEYDKRRDRSWQVILVVLSPIISLALAAFVVFRGPR